VLGGNISKFILMYLSAFFEKKGGQAHMAGEAERKDVF